MFLILLEVILSSFQLTVQYNVSLIPFAIKKLHMIIVLIGFGFYNNPARIVKLDFKFIIRVRTSFGYIDRKIRHI